MTDQHPITPPPELRRLWAQQAQRLDPHDPVAWMEHVSTQAARWGADQELEACVEWLTPRGWAVALHEARRPKPPSLVEEALLAIDTAVADNRISAEIARVTRRALERLQHLEQESNDT